MPRKYDKAYYQRLRKKEPYGVFNYIGRAMGSIIGATTGVLGTAEGGGIGGTVGGWVDGKILSDWYNADHEGIGSMVPYSQRRIYGSARRVTGSYAGSKKAVNARVNKKYRR